MTSHLPSASVVLVLRKIKTVFQYLRLVNAFQINIKTIKFAVLNQM